MNKIELTSDEKAFLEYHIFMVGSANTLGLVFGDKKYIPDDFLSILKLIESDEKCKGIRLGKSKNFEKNGYYIHVYKSNAKFHYHHGASWEAAALKALMFLRGYSWVGNKEWTKIKQ